MWTAVAVSQATTLLLHGAVGWLMHPYRVRSGLYRVTDDLLEHDLFNEQDLLWLQQMLTTNHANTPVSAERIRLHARHNHAVARHHLVVQYPSQPHSSRISHLSLALASRFRPGKHPSTVV
jgi:hypothetical protein